MAVQNAINLTSTGMVSADGAGVFAGRAITGGTGITVSNGDGVAGAPDIVLDTPVIVANGGTGATTLTDGGIVLGSGTSAVTITAQPVDGQVLIGSTGLDPVLATLSTATGITITEGAGTITIDLTSPVVVANGGSGRAVATEYAVICGGTTTTAAHQSIASVGTAAQVLTSNGAGALPTFQAAGGGGGSWAWVSTTVASDDATVDFINLTATGYLVIVKNLIPESDSSLRMRVSDDNGVTFEVIDYQDAWHLQTGATFEEGGTASNTEIDIGGFGGTIGANTAAGEYGLSGSFYFLGIATTATPASVTYSATLQNELGDMAWAAGSGISTDDGGAGATLDIDGIQFYLTADNIESGTFYLYSLVTS